MIMTRNEMLKELNEGICVVRFEKTDGTERTMRCTLNSISLKWLGLTDKAGLSEDKSAADSSQEIIRVFDIDNEGWRSFKINKVKRFF